MTEDAIPYPLRDRARKTSVCVVETRATTERHVIRDDRVRLCVVAGAPEADGYWHFLAARLDPAEARTLAAELIAAADSI